jgi:tetratricopeptide (TPR) repeat protein
VTSAERRAAWAASVLAVGLALCVLVLYEPVASHEFLEYDDGLYVTGSERVQAGFTRETALWALTSLEIGNWHPLTWWSHALAVEWFGLDAGAHHRVSVVLHAAVSAVLLATLYTATGSLLRSALVAALFALHPMRIESVAWIAERKDVLFGLFYVLAIAAHTAWVRRPSAPRYALVLAAGLAALMSKAMAVTLPAVLLLFDHWPLRRERRLVALVVEKLPLIALSAVASVLAMWAQDAGGAMATLEALPFSRRLASALVSYGAYLGSTFWPLDLAVFYPHPPDGYGTGTVVAAAAAVAGLAAFAGLELVRHPPIGVGLLWFFGTLVPVIGLVAVGEQVRADRYSYLPSIGLAIAVVWALPDSWLRRRLVHVVLAGILLALAAATWQQIPHWRSDETLFARALAVTDDNHVAHLNYGNAIESDERREEQRFHFERVVALAPGHPLGHYNLGRVLAKTGDPEGAVVEYRRSLAIDPDHPRAWNNLGNVLSQLERPELAERAYRRALEVAPDHPSSLFNLAMLLLGRGAIDEGVQLGQRYLELRPDDAASRTAFAGSLAELGRPEAARAALAEAPGLSAEALALLAGLEWARGAEAEALAAGERAFALAPQSAAIANDLAWMLATAVDVARRDPVRALELARAANDTSKRRDPDVLDTLAAAHAVAGDFAAATAAIDEAIDRARDSGRLDLIPTLEQRAARYRANRPYRRTGSDAAAARP